MPITHDGLAWLLRLIAFVALLAGTMPSRAAPAAETRVPIAREAETAAETATVSFRGRKLFTIRGSIGSLDVGQRVAGIESRLVAAASLPDDTLGRIRSVRTAGSYDVYAGEQFIMSVADRDAASLGRTNAQFAADVAVVVREALREDYRARSAAGVLRSAVLSLVAVIVGVLSWLALHRGVMALESAGRRTLQRPAGFAGATTNGLLSEQAAELLGMLLRGFRMVAGLIVVVFTVGYVMRQFPWTSGPAVLLDREIRAAVRGIGTSVVEYLPNVVYIALLVVIFRVLIRFARLFFDRVGSGQLAITGFHAEWAQPTFQIVRVLLVAFAAAVIFPYLPASDSRAFQGVSVLLGIVLSFGSATAVANLIGGLVITYMRAFRVGDRVRIGEYEGDVISRDAFVVRIRTIKNVEITLPNASVLSGSVVNYSAGARDVGLLVHSSVTIGYDSSWRQVHDLLVDAALRTTYVEPEPKPFVHQLQLDDFYVHYQINAYTRYGDRTAPILSELHANIQDAFAAAGVEIMSPHYRAGRDGSASTIPDLGVSPADGPGPA